MSGGQNGASEIDFTQSLHWSRAIGRQGRSAEASEIQDGRTARSDVLVLDPRHSGARDLFAETQAFADEVATQISAQPGIAANTVAGGKGAIYSAGGHIIIGIPAVENQLEK